MKPQEQDCSELFAPMIDVSWHVSGISYHIAGRPENGHCALYCFCNVPAKLRDGHIICGNVNVCVFYLPNYQSVLFYVKEVLGALFNVQKPPVEYIKERELVWLLPHCTCGDVMKLGIWASKTGGGALYCNAVCRNKACFVNYTTSSQILEKMSEYLEKNPKGKDVLARRIE